MKPFVFFAGANATGQLLLGHSDKDRILTDAFDLVPWNYQVLLPAKSQESTMSRNDQGENFCILFVKLKVGCVSKSCAVTQIDDLQGSQIRGAAAFHHTVDSFLFFVQ